MPLMKINGECFFDKANVERHYEKLMKKDSLQAIYKTVNKIE